MAVGVCQACRVHLPHAWNGFIQSTPAVIGTFREAWRVNYPNDRNSANSSMPSSFCLFFFLLSTFPFGLICFAAIFFFFFFASKKVRKRPEPGRSAATFGFYCRAADERINCLVFNKNGGFFFFFLFPLRDNVKRDAQASQSERFFLYLVTSGFAVRC